MKNRLYLAFGMLMIGSFVVVNKRIVSEVPIFIASELRLVVAALCLLIWARIHGQTLRVLRKSDLLFIFIQAFIGVFLFSIFTLNGLKHTSAMNGGIIMGITPVAILVLSFLSKKESLNRYSVLSALCACGGAIALNITTTANTHDASWLGNGLVFLAMLCEAVFISAGQFIRKGIPPLIFSIAMSSFGALLFLPLSLLSLPTWHPGTVSTLTWWYVIYTGAGTTAIGAALVTLGSSRLPMSTAATFSAFMPTSSCLLAALLLGESFQTTHGIGLALIMAGILLTIYRDSTKQQRRLQNI